MRNVDEEAGIGAALAGRTFSINMGSREEWAVARECLYPRICGQQIITILARRDDLVGRPVIRIKGHNEEIH